MTSSWMGAWLLWFCYAASEWRIAMATYEFFDAYNRPEFRAIERAALRPSPFMQHITRSRL